MRTLRRTATILPLLLSLHLVFSAGCGSRPQKRNIVLVTFDTVRIDKIGCYGAPSSATPNIDALSREGITFRNAHCQAPITRPSHASMLTSLYPRSHGVMTNRDPFAPDIPFLPELLRRAGYATGAFTGVRLFAKGGDFDRGFDFFSSPV